MGRLGHKIPTLQHRGFRPPHIPSTPGLVFHPDLGATPPSPTFQTSVPKRRRRDTHSGSRGAGSSRLPILARQTLQRRNPWHSAPCLSFPIHIQGTVQGKPHKVILWGQSSRRSSPAALGRRAVLSLQLFQAHPTERRQDGLTAALTFTAPFWGRKWSILTLAPLGPGKPITPGCPRAP